MELPLEQRQHFFRLINGRWSFIANFSPHQSALIPVERWRSQGHTYILCLRVYTKSEAGCFIAERGTRLMQGPEIYWVMCDDTPQPLLIAYKPDMIDQVELQSYASEERKYVQVDADMSYDSIKREIQTLLGLENVIVEMRSEMPQLCAIQYNF